MKLTREQAIEEHRKMWNLIADEILREKRKLNISDLKYKYCVKNGFKNINADCFLCEYTNYNCNRRPIDWKNDSKMFMCEKNQGLWIKCRDAENWQEQAALARQIANLPERTDV